MFSSNTSQVSNDAVFVEDVFSTWLYTGNSSTQTITNGIDLAGKGGLVWVKQRDVARSNFLTDTLRGAGYSITSNDTAAQVYDSTRLTAFSSNGFSVGSSSNFNNSGQTYASWTFRKQPKFFDVVTWTGTGANRTVAHSLGSVPGCIIVKRTDTTGAWQVYHRSLANTEYMVLNTTAAKATGATRWNSTTPTSTEFSLGTDVTVNASGGTYAAYVFAHDAGGFGLSGTDNVISCGSYTGNGSTTGPVIDLGYEPQWILVKRATVSTGNWYLYDTMRGWTVEVAGNNALYANLSNAEINDNFGRPTATGFQVLTSAAALNETTQTYIYIAIRRGPMKTPTSGTSVFFPKAISSDASGILVDSGWPVDFYGTSTLTSTGGPWVLSRLTGNTQLLRTPLTNAEATFSSSFFSLDRNNGLFQNNWQGAQTQVGWSFRRAPGFFDVVCYTGTGSVRTVAHNLGVAPELMIIKARGGGVSDWRVYISPSTNLLLNTTDSVQTDTVMWNNTAPTSSVFSLGNRADVNENLRTYVAYLFASCPGVSKVGSYTGNGTNQTINCGFTGGARFILIKRTNSTGDWYVWDTARGIVTGNDPRLSLNSTAAEVTTDDTIDPANSGFIVNQLAATNVNVNAATYIYLAIA